MDEINIQDVLRRIEWRIAELGMSKTEFYRESGITSANYSQWKTKTHRPTKKKLARAASVLKVSLEYLLYGEKGIKNPPDPEAEGIALKDWEREALDCLRALPHDDLVRELAYLRERAAGQGK